MVELHCLVGELSCSLSQIFRITSCKSVSCWLISTRLQHPPNSKQKIKHAVYLVIDYILHGRTMNKFSAYDIFINVISCITYILDTGTGKTAMIESSSY